MSTSVGKESRLVGFDDAPHAREDASCSLVGVVMRGATYVEAILRTQATPDGDDATTAIANSVLAYRGRTNLVAILLQNVMVGGFNVLDLDALNAATGLPVVAVAKGTPDLPAVRQALVEGKIPGGAAKWRLMEKVEDRRVPLHEGRANMVAVGLPRGDAIRLVEGATIRGLMPEPLRLAHLIGAGWVLGESRGS